MKSRAIRRHHTERIKQRVKKYYGGVSENDSRRIGQLARSRTPCSCFMCGNPRKYENQLTIQERREDERFSRHSAETSEGIS